MTGSPGSTSPFIASGSTSAISFDPTKGGFISSRGDFLNFMYNMARNNPNEVAAFQVSKGNCTEYFIQPWDQNLPNRSHNYFDNIPDYTRGDIIAEYHTHPNSSPPGIFDAQLSCDHGIPVYSMGANGNMWCVSYCLGCIPPTGLIPQGYKEAIYGNRIW
jgi:hypothetical protein